MRYFLLLATLVLAIGCSLFGPVTVGRRFVDLPPRVESCGVAFVEAPPASSAAALVGELAIDANDPAPESWKDEVRRKACGLGADTVWVTPLTERRDEWTYCGGRDSLCRDRFLVRYLGTALAYREYRSTGHVPASAAGTLPTPTVPPPDSIE